ncbi:MAG: protein kinase family protein [Planctomycetota bacterium]|nr:protein kinase family protein [Planctomycetota bacterium]
MGTGQESCTVIGTTLNTRFYLEKELGRGGMGAVYRARDTVLERSVAIKVLKDLTGEEVGKRIKLEAQILARLVHSHIVRLYDLNIDNETFYFIMEEVDGTSFSRRSKKIDLNERLRVVAETAEALDYAHHQGVIHRDVKPANILLTATDVAKLSDFGLSLLSDATQESGIVRGTPHYMSPEQAKGKKIDFRTDLYALGVILYECATGSPPFTGPVMTVMAQHINAEVEPPRSKNPEVSEDLEALILELMAKEPILRPNSGAEVAGRLRALIAGGMSGSGSAQPASADRPASSPLASASGGSAGASGPASMNASGSNGPSVGSHPSLIAAEPSKSIVANKGLHEAARAIVDAVTADPIELSPDERYLHGHYLAYFLGGSRRRGFLLRRPLDPLNSDRARLLLAMTALTLPGGEEIPMEKAAALLDEGTDVRPMLSPVVVAKYLAARSSPPKRKRFRQIRQQLQQASVYATQNLTDEQGILNPGLMPQALDDLRRLAPARTEVDDELVHRWNEVAEVWRTKPDFCQAVLRYATKSAWRDPSSAALWPEVVYPLIERARRQRQLRSGTEAVWDAVCGSLLHIGDAGVKMDRAIRISVPALVVQQLDVSLDKIIDDPVLEFEPAPEPPPEAEGLRLKSHISAASFHDLEVDQPTRNFVRLISPDPFRQTLGELRTLWQEATAAMRAGPGGTQSQRHVPLGIYRLVVVPSVRSRSAGQLAIQGMPNKQVELLVPPFSSGGPVTKLLLAVWLYSNNSIALTYCDNLNSQKFVVWDANVAQQTNFDDAAAFNHHLYGLGLEVPDQLDRVLTKSYRPQKPVGGA